MKPTARVLVALSLMMAAVLPMLAGARPSAAQSGYPILEEFDSSDGFSSSHPGQFVFSGGELNWTVCRGRGEQYLYRSIPTFSGDVRITVRGRIDSYVNNSVLWVGIGDEPGTGVGVAFLFTGGGCAAPCGSTYIWGQWNYIELMRDGMQDAEPDGCCGLSWTYLPAELGTYYTAELVISGENVSLSVPGLGTASGTTSYTGPYDTLYLYYAGGTHSYCLNGAIDWVKIEPLPATDTTPPVWNSSPLPGGIRDAYQIGDGKVRVFWVGATDPESPPVMYRVYESDINDLGIVECDTSLSRFTGFDCHADVDVDVGYPGWPCRFSVSAVNSVEPVGLEATSPWFISLDMYDFKTFAELQDPLWDPDTAEDLVGQVFVTEVMAHNYHHGLKSGAEGKADAAIGVVHIIRLLAEHNPWVLVGETVLGEVLKAIVKTATDFQAVTFIGETDPLDQLPPVGIAKPINRDTRLPRGKPVMVQGRFVRASEHLLTFEPLTYHIHWERYRSLPQYYGLDQITSVSGLLCEGDISHATGGSVGAFALIGQVSYRWKEGDYAYLELLDIESTDCEPCDSLLWCRLDPVIVEMPLAADIPDVGSVVRADGVLMLYYEQCGNAHAPVESTYRTNLVLSTTFPSSGGNCEIVVGKSSEVYETKPPPGNRCR